MVVHLIKSARRTTVSYVATPLVVSPDYALVRAQWTRPAVDLGYMQFAPGDILDEHFYADQWYSIFAVYQGSGSLRGWYCNVSRPALITATSSLIYLSAPTVSTCNASILMNTKRNNTKSMTQPPIRRAGWHWRNSKHWYSQGMLPLT